MHVGMLGKWQFSPVIYLKRIVQDGFSASGDLQNILNLLSKDILKTYGLTKRKTEQIYRAIS